MENTGKVRLQFEDDSPQWYIAVGDRWVGPLTASDVYEKVVNGEITWVHYVWKPGQSDWKRLSDVKTFQAAMPALPAKDMQKEIQAVVKQARTGTTAPPPAPMGIENAKIWFLYFNDAQVGPFSKEEVDRFLQVGKINPRVHAWRDGMTDWKRIKDIDAFEAAVEASPPSDEPGGGTAAFGRGLARTSSGKTGKVHVPPEGVERRRKERVEHRGSPRRPLVAKILVAHEDSVAVAVCRDISIGGMQVLTDRIPGKPGARLKINVSPLGSEHEPKGSRIDPFVAEGVIVRVLEDGRGFSFRFEKMSPSARKSIEKFIAADEAGGGK